MKQKSLVGRWVIVHWEDDDAGETMSVAKKIHNGMSDKPHILVRSWASREEAVGWAIRNVNTERMSHFRAVKL